MDQNIKIETAKQMSNSEVYKLFSEVMDHMIKYYSGQIDKNKWQEKMEHGVECLDGRDKFFEVIKNTPRLIEKEKPQALDPINYSQYDEQIKIHLKNIFNDQEIFTVMYNKYFDLQVFKYFNLLMNKGKEVVGASLTKRLSNRNLQSFTYQGTTLEQYFQKEIKEELNLNHIEQYFADFAFEFLGKMDNVDYLSNKDFYNFIYRWNSETLNFLWDDLKKKGIEKKDIDGKIEFISPNLKELYEKNSKLKDFVKNGVINEKYFEPEKKVEMDNSSMLDNLKKRFFGSNS